MFCADVIHEGHKNIIKLDKQHGDDVVVGVLSDKAMLRFNRFPLAALEERMEMARSIEGVSRAIVQEDTFYDDAIEQAKLDYVVHGDNWKTGYMKHIRDNVEEALRRQGKGEIIDAPYTYNEDVQRIDVRNREKLAMPEHRLSSLRKLIDICDIVKVIEVHSGLIGLIVEKTVVFNGEDLDQFNAMWMRAVFAVSGPSRSSLRRQATVP